MTPEEKVCLRNYVVKKGTSKKVHQPWTGQFEVKEVIGENNVEFQLPRQKKDKIKIANIAQIKPAREIDWNLDEITKVHDKLQSRIQRQSLVTRYFVEFRDGHMQWVALEFVPDQLLGDFDAKK